MLSGEDSLPVTDLNQYIYMNQIIRMKYSKEILNLKINLEERKDQSKKCFKET